jgi:multiple sugar transport system substrate-binding protein
MKKWLLIMIICLALGFTALGKTKVTVWFAGTPEALMEAVDDRLVPAFEKANPDIELAVEYIPWGELSTKLTTAFAGGIGPDIFMHGQAAIAGFAETGVIMSIDSLIDKLEDPEDFGGTLSVGLYRGKNFMVPVFGSGRLLAYREDFFVESGLDPDEPPVTWEQLRAYAEALTIYESGRLVRAGLDIPVSGIDLQQVWTGFLIANNGALFDNDFNPTFNDQAGVEALEYYVDLIREGKVASEYGLTPVGNLAPIAAGTAAMCFMNNESLAAIKEYSPDVYSKIRLAFPPARYDRAGFYSFAGFMVSSSTKNLDATAKALAFLTSKEGLIEINTALGSLPPRQSGVEAEYIANDPNLMKFVEGSKYAYGNPNVPFWVQARDIISKYLERSVMGVMTPKDALDGAAEEISKLK